MENITNACLISLVLSFHINVYFCFLLFRYWYLIFTHTSSIPHTSQINSLNSMNSSKFLNGKALLSLLHNSVANYSVIRIHSSNMRTVRCSGHLVCVCVCVGGGSVLGELPRQVSALGGVYPGGCLPREGDVCLGRGMSAGGVCQGVSAQGVSAQGVSVDRMTDRCKNITLPQLRGGR